MKPSRLWAASLSAALVIVIASAASATPPDAVTAPADTVTLEVLESNSDHIYPSGPKPATFATT